MQVDRYTKGVLTVIAAFLGIIAISGGNRGGGTRSYAAPPTAGEASGATATPFAHYQVSTYKDGEGNLHLLVVDNWKDKLFDHQYTTNDTRAEGVPVHAMTTGQ